MTDGGGAEHARRASHDDVTLSVTYEGTDPVQIKHYNGDARPPAPARWTFNVEDGNVSLDSKTVGTHRIDDKDTKAMVDAILNLPFVEGIDWEGELNG